HNCFRLSISSVNASRNSRGARSATHDEISNVYGRTRELPRKVGVGEGEKATSTSTNAAITKAPRNTPAIPPRKRLNHERPIQLNNRERRAEIKEPRISTAIKIIRNPKMSATVTV